MEEDLKEKQPSNIILTERQKIEITGITKLDNFDNEEFLLQTTLGALGISGKDLEIIKLDTTLGTICIKGIFNSISYLDGVKSKKETSMITRLFK